MTKNENRPEIRFMDLDGTLLCYPSLFYEVKPYIYPTKSFKTQDIVFSLAYLHSRCYYEVGYKGTVSKHFTILYCTKEGKSSDGHHVFSRGCGSKLLRL